MKREHPNPNPNPNPYANYHHQVEYRRPPPPGSTGEGSMAAKVWEGCVDGGMDDELLAVLGYKVRSSDIPDVAQMLEQLDDAMCSSSAAAPPQPEEGPSHPAADSVHYNPSELSVWLDSMLSDLTPPPPPPPDGSSFPSYEESSSDYDLKAIPGRAVFADSSSSSSSKRIRTAEPLSPPPPIPPPQQTAVVVDSQENGIRLVHALMACAEAVQAGGLSVAEALVKQINLLAASQAGAMRKVATYFAQALARRIYGIPAAEIAATEASLADFLQMHFYESCPYLKFAHFTANQAILEAFQGKPRVHVIDFSMGQGMQWPALMQALALIPGGPPAFRLTGIGPPSHDNSDRLQEVGLKLAELAETVGVEFEYRGFVANSLADLDAAMLELRPGEAVAVNSVFELHKLLARPGAIEKVLSAVGQMSPEIVTVVEQEASHNGAAFVERFTEALHYYSTMFDSLEGSSSAAMAEAYLGKQIANVVACEGPDRVERHETMGQWRDRFEAAGFGPAHLGSNAFKQASMLLALYAGGDGYGVEEKGGCLTLGWHSRPLIATSAWKLRGSAPRLIGSSG